MGRRRIATALVAAAAAAGLAVAGCGGKEFDQTIKIEKQPAASPTPAGGPLDDLSGKPAIPKPSGNPPAKLEVEDIVEGKGREARDGDQVTVQYVGISWSTGEQFDASWDNGQPFTFKLGAGGVIKGWDRGVKGMRVGGRRKLTIPPDLAYGEGGSGPIGPNETLVFVVDLKKVR
jgi:peptidylprolyl isomerase